MSQPKTPIQLDDVDVNSIELIQARLRDVSNVLLQYAAEAMKHQKTLDDYMARLGTQKSFDPTDYEMDFANKRLVPKTPPVVKQIDPPILEQK